MKTDIGNVLPRMNSMMPAMFIAMPPRNKNEPETAPMDPALEPWKSRTEKITQEYGIRKPRTPSKVGFPGIRQFCIFDV